VALGMRDEVLYNDETNGRGPSVQDRCASHDLQKLIPPLVHHVSSSLVVPWSQSGKESCQPLDFIKLGKAVVCDKCGGTGIMDSLETCESLGPWAPSWAHTEVKQHPSPLHCTSFMGGQSHLH